MTVKQVYEWVKTGHWSLMEFREWVEAVLKEKHHDC